MKAIIISTIIAAWIAFTWILAKAAGRASCEWMQRGVPVKGWNAEPTIVYPNKNRRAHSFMVRECPKFVPYHARSECMIERDW